MCSLVVVEGCVRCQWQMQTQMMGAVNRGRRDGCTRRALCDFLKSVPNTQESHGRIDVTSVVRGFNFSEIGRLDTGERSVQKQERALLDE